MAITLNGTSGVTSPTYGGTVTAEYSVPVTAFKNRIINGAMMIDQRNAGASVTPTTDNTYTLDRWTLRITQSSKVSIQQNAGSVTPPVGFKNYLGATSLSAYSIVSSDYFNIRQLIEGLNVSDLGWGTANAATVTLSFWVRSSLTGTFGGALNNSAFDRSYPFTYTISSANTWEQKTVTITGDTSGTWLTTNGVGLAVSFGLGIGSTYTGTAGAWAGATYLGATGATSVVGTNGATFYITGVQLEKGSTATSFDYRPYGTELQLCQRYCYVQKQGGASSGICSGVFYTGTLVLYAMRYPAQMRTSPTLTYSALSDFQALGSGNTFVPSAITLSSTGTDSGRLDLTVSGGTGGWGSTLQTVNANSSLTFNAEL